MPKPKKRTSMLRQVARLFVIGTLLIAFLTCLAVLFASYGNVRSQFRERAQAVALDLENYIIQYPAHDWLLNYWYNHYEDLDIDYDAAYSPDTATAEKCQELADHQPDFQLLYASTEEVEALPAEDQKLYAEIVYSRLITNLDQIAEDNSLDYLFGTVAEEPYDKQFILFIASCNTKERGTERGQLYPIGKVVKASEAQQKAMQGAAAGSPQTAVNKDGNYFDYYYAIGSIDGHDLLIGLSRRVDLIRRSVYEQTAIMSLLSSLFLITLAAVCLLMILFIVLRPLKNVQQTIRLYKNTKDSETVRQTLAELKSHNEIARLSDDFADLTQEIDDYTSQIETITSEKERIETELNLAARIQRAMLPSKFPPYPERGDFDIYASMTPARDIGGDFYDFFLIDNDHLGLVMADVSGKGIPAALYMMACKIILKTNARRFTTPAQILTDTNETIIGSNSEEMFVTVWLGILDLTTGILTASNAGHEYPIVMSPGGRFELIKDKHSLVVGGMAGITYRDYEIPMTPGSKLFLYTDGLPEATASDHQMFGMDRILTELNKHREASPEEIDAAMREAVSAFVQEAEQFDDLTMMCLTYNGPASDE